MMTALCAAKNIMGAKYDLWAINSESDYYEEKREHNKPTLPETEAGRLAFAEPLRIPRRRSPIGQR